LRTLAAGNIRAFRPHGRGPADRALFRKLSPFLSLRRRGPHIESIVAPLPVVSNIDDDLLALTPLQRDFDLVCTAQRARGYKPDGTLFRYLIEHAGCAKEEILHAGQSQFTDLVGGKPLGLTIAWINRRQIALDGAVPRPDYIFPDVQALSGLVES
jgi:FMN phosphatase YigB (HAD superfamily)